MVRRKLSSEGIPTEMRMEMDIAGRWKRFKLFDRNLAIYGLILSLVILVFQGNLNYWYIFFFGHLFLVGALFFIIPWLDKQTKPVLRFLRDWYIILILPFLYSDVGFFLHLVTYREFDPFIIHMDKWIFGVLPNVWIQNYVNPQLTEFMQISYSIYWFTIPLGGAIFYFSKQPRLFEKLLYYVTFTFFFSYLVFIFFPVAGPRFYIAGQIHASYHSLFFGNILRHFVQNVGFRGGAFPSSHVGVAVTILIFMWKFKPKTAMFVFLPMVLALSAATVYGQYHYFTDVIAGLLMGIVIGGWAILHTPKSLMSQSREKRSLKL
ncbi:MAG: phosphatase PAP2 family protein [Calditrichia bacterium]